jgi:hypothetical protein
LRPLAGGVRWQGEIEPDTVNNFSRFQDVGYGIRAMITDITGDIVNDGKNTLRKLVTAYAPPGENNTNAYIATVANLTGLQPDQVIPVSEYWIRKIITAKIAVELGQQFANRISNSDIDAGFNRLSNTVKQWMNYTGSTTSGNSLIVLIIAATAGYMLIK